MEQIVGVLKQAEVGGAGGSADPPGGPSRPCQRLFLQLLELPQRVGLQSLLLFLPVNTVFGAVPSPSSSSAVIAEYTSKRNDDPRSRKLCFVIGNHALRGAHSDGYYLEQVRTNINVLHKQFYAIN